jgi:hypothetical protein
MKKTLLTVLVLGMVVTTQASGEILRCEGSIVNSRNDFEKRITVYIDVVIPDEIAEEYILTLADEKTGKLRSLLSPTPLVRKTFLEIAKSFDKGGKQQPKRYDFIVTKMPDNSNSLVGFVYGFEPWILKVDTWKANKPFIFFQTGIDDFIQGECK